MKRPVVFRFDRGRFRWRGIPPRPYKAINNAPPAWRGVQRFVLVGAAGEPTAFHLRYFEIAPGGFSFFERHHYAHAVLIVRGRGRIRVGNAVHRVGPMDFIFIPPDAPHQFRAGRKHFGFLCPVDTQRDRPRPASSGGARGAAGTAPRGRSRPALAPRARRRYN